MTPTQIHLADKWHLDTKGRFIVHEDGDELSVDMLTSGEGVVTTPAGGKYTLSDGAARRLGRLYRRAMSRIYLTPSWYYDTQKRYIYNENGDGLGVGMLTSGECVVMQDDGGTYTLSDSARTRLEAALYAKVEDY